MKVNIEEVIGINKRLADIDAANLADIEWYENGKKIEVTSEALEEFRFIGLCNRSFIEYGFHESGLISSK